MGLFVGQDFNLTGKTAARWLVCCCLNQNHEFRWSLATLHATVTPCITFFDWLSCFSFTILVATGRAIMSLWMGNLPVHELYTAACGLYFIWLVCRLCVVAMSWVPLGIRGMAEKVGNWIFLVRKHMHKNWITNIFASPHESQSLLQEFFPGFLPTFPPSAKINFCWIPILSLGDPFSLVVKSGARPLQHTVTYIILLKYELALVFLKYCTVFCRV